MEVDNAMGRKTDSRKRKIKECEDAILRKRRKIAKEKASENLQGAAPVRMQKALMGNRPLPQVIASKARREVLSENEIALQKDAQGFCNSWIIRGMVLEMFSGLVEKENEENDDPMEI